MGKDRAMTGGSDLPGHAVERYRENSSLGQPWTVAERLSLFKGPVQKMTALGSEERGV